MSAHTALAPGTAAPEFTLRSTPDQAVSLSEFRGKPVILAFYPADWSPVCGDQLALYNEVLPEFQRMGAELIGVSVDGVWCHSRLRQRPQAALPDPVGLRAEGSGGEALRSLPRGDGTSERALFVLDAEGIIRWSYVSPVGINPGADGILNALDGLTPGVSHDDRRKRTPLLPVSERDHIQGPADAPVTLVEYGDYECPHCGRVYPIVKAVQQRLGERLRFVFRNFPLSQSTPRGACGGGGRGGGSAG